MGTFELPKRKPPEGASSNSNLMILDQAANF
jgi:hypothetical protein